MAAIFFILHVLIQVTLVIRVLLRPHRQPASRIAWIVVIISFPVLGFLAYILIGETSIGRRRIERLREVLSRLPNIAASDEPLPKCSKIMSAALCSISRRCSAAISRISLHSSHLWLQSYATQS
jgi:hypothetical protein